MQLRRDAALASFKAGKDPAGVQCPNCGGYRLQAVRVDADGTLITGAISLVVGLVALLLVFVAGDVGLYIADTSTLAAVLVVVGVLLLWLARRRRAPSAFECFGCGYRVP